MDTTLEIFDFQLANALIEDQHMDMNDNYNHHLMMNNFQF